MMRIVSYQIVSIDINHITYPNAYRKEIKFENKNIFIVYRKLNYNASYIRL